MLNEPNLQYLKTISDKRGTIIFMKNSRIFLNFVEIKQGFSRGGHFHPFTSSHNLISGKVEYMEEELNQLMSQKNKNEDFAKSSFEQRVKESKEKAIEDNVSNAEKNDIQLTQTIDKDGNLIGVNNMNTQEDNLKEQDTISSADIRNELFEGENIIIGKSDNGQSQLLSGPFATKKED